MSLEVETTTVGCSNCDSSFRIIGKNGTSIDYVVYCPGCGAGHLHVDVNTEIIDIINDDPYEINNE